MSVKSTAHPLPLLPLFPCPPVFWSRSVQYPPWQLLATLLLNFSYFPVYSPFVPSSLPPPLCFSPHLPLFKMISCPVSSQGSRREKGGQITLQRQISSSGLCVCECVWVCMHGGQVSWDTHIIPEPWGQADGLASWQAPGLSDETRLAMNNRVRNVYFSMCVLNKVRKKGKVGR